mgnify:FL=1
MLGRPEHLGPKVDTDPESQEAHKEVQETQMDQNWGDVEGDVLRALQEEGVDVPVDVIRTINDQKDEVIKAALWQLNAREGSVKAGVVVDADDMLAETIRGHIREEMREHKEADADTAKDGEE